MERRVLEETVVMPPTTPPPPGSEFAKIAGLDLAKRILQESVIEPFLHPDVYTGLRAPPKGVLLFGPPGTGKTLLARAVSREAKACFFNVSASSITSKWVGEGEKLVRALFSVARRYAPSVIFLDEVDALLSARAHGENEASRRLKTEFLIQMDGVATSESDRVLLMGATNLPQELDEAAIRRFQRRVYIPLPEEGDRKAILALLTTGESLSLSKADVAGLVRATEGFSGSDLKALCQEAAQGPVRELRAALRPGQVMRREDLPPLSNSHFQEALRIVRPSVPPSSIVAFERWARDFAVKS
jgi:fidgetin-like protein 1